MQRWRKLLLPFSWLYGAVVWIRNLCYDWKIFESKKYTLPVLCIGNLSVGGTGKTPMTEYIAQLLATSYNTAILSRGYKRASEGFVLADQNATVRSLGDEPYQYFNKLSNVKVAVDQDRRHGIEELTTHHNVEVVLLDDGFQHRKVQANFNILLTMYGDLYVDDLLLPAGNLRDTKSQSKRADIVVVTKCPVGMSQAEMDATASRLQLSGKQQLFFSCIEYNHGVIGQNQQIALSKFNKQPITLVTGIAKPEPMVNYLKDQGVEFNHLEYPDHHNFTEKQIKELSNCGVILTTEKDYMRLYGRVNQLYYLPIRVKILQNENAFNVAILNAVKAYIA